VDDDIDPDLIDLLACWHGRETPPQREQELLGRLGSDGELRKAYAEQVSFAALLSVALRSGRPGPAGGAGGRPPS
jgi:hypothetical protein